MNETIKFSKLDSPEVWSDSCSQYFVFSKNGNNSAEELLLEFNKRADELVKLRSQNARYKKALEEIKDRALESVPKEWKIYPITMLALEALKEVDDGK